MAANRDSYVQQTKAKLGEVSQELERLRTKADAAGVEVRGKFQRQVKELQTRRDRVAQKLNAVKAAEEAEWEDARRGVEAAWTDLLTAFNRARNQIR